MLELFVAEWNKITGHRWNAAFLVWIFPLGALVIGAFAVLITLLSGQFREAQTALGIDPWDESFLYGWQIVNSEFGRFMAVVFAATVFAREYAYGTWKNLITRRARVTLIVVKFVTMALMLTLAFVLMTLILGLASGLVAGYLGLDFGSITGPRVADFVAAYGEQVFVTLASVLIAAGYAAVASLVTHNVLTAAVVGVVFTVAEQGILIPIGLLDSLLGIDLRMAYFLLPGYNLANVSSYLNSGSGYAPFAQDTLTVIPFSFPLSLLIVGLWLFGLIGLAIWRFRQQDITV